MKWAYFKEVISTGGAEGKLLQSVTPYRYAVWDAKFARTAALLAQPSALSPLIGNATRAQLWAEWRRFWTPGLVLVDKSPENVLMAPFLQAMFGRARTAFVFVMRHPLCWAIVAAKWGCIWRPIPGSVVKVPSPECITHLIEVWLAVYERLSSQLPDLESAKLLAAESDEWLARPDWLDNTGIGTPQSGEIAARWKRTQANFRDSSHAYVHCFLRGYAVRRTRIEGDRCEEHGVRETSAAERQTWLHQLGIRLGGRVRALGYTMDLGQVASTCCKSSWQVWRAPATPDRVFAAAAPLTSPHDGSRYGRYADGGEGLGLHTGAVALFIGTNFLSGFNGMQQRAAQVAAAVGKLGYSLHFVSSGPLESTSECASAAVPVVCHATGNSTTQYDAFVQWARATRAAPAVVIVGFTSLALEVSRTLERVPKSKLEHWQEDGRYDPSHVPKAHHTVQLLEAVSADFPTAVSVVFTDDVHFKRSRDVLELAGRASPISAHHARVLAAAKSLELRTYAKARLLILISEADRSTLARAAPELVAAGDGRMEGVPLVAIVPFRAAPLANNEVVALRQRWAGRMLYVGTCHPIAKASVTWFVKFVLPQIMRLATTAGSPKGVQLRIAGNGWVHLAKEAPFARWVEQSVLIILGKLSPAALAAEYQKARLFVSPLLNATGIATKNFHAMASGLPVLTSAVGIAGLRLPSKPLRLCCGGEHEPPAYCMHDTPLVMPKRPTLAQDCKAYPKRMECAAWAAAKGEALPTTARATSTDAGDRDGGQHAHDGHHHDDGDGRRRQRRSRHHRGGRKLLHGGQGGGGDGQEGDLERATDTSEGDENRADDLNGRLQIGRGISAALHRSRTILVAESPASFAEAAVDALSDDALWHTVSQNALRHQRLLSKALQSAEIARGIAGGGVQARLPAERSCIVLCSERKAADVGYTLRTVLGQLLRLRIAAHIVMLAEANEPSSEEKAFGWAQTQGVFFYSGSPLEQWSAIRAASPYPPVSFAVVVDAATDDATSLHEELLACMAHEQHLPVVGAEQLPSAELEVHKADQAWTSLLTKVLHIER
jgi:hypothetical protein